MAAPANNPFGAPPSQVSHSPFGGPAFGQPASAFKPSPRPFGTTAPKSNPFGTTAANPPGAPVNNPFGASAPAGNSASFGKPFGALSGQTSALGTPAASPAPSRQPSPSVAQNRFAKPPAQQQAKNPFGGPPTGPKAGRSASPFGSRAPSTEPPDPSAMGRLGKAAGGKLPATTNSGGFGGRGGHNKAAGAQRSSLFAGTKPSTNQSHAPGPAATAKVQPSSRDKQKERHQPAPSKPGRQNTRAAGPSERTKELSPFAFKYANELYDHLKKENIHAPKWPAEPGNPDKRGAIESLKDAYKKYRTRVYASLRKVDLIDDPEKRRKLEDALPFKGICEDMCPEFEQVYRIAEYDVKTEEKETRPDSISLWPDPSRMVKKFGRSAAGQDAPLPMDVRSVDALRRTTDYLFNELLQSENNLPSMHNFLWDRTRAVRKDFTFHSQKSAAEMKDMVYCFETITRFHATALHLLSRKGFANEDFDQKQEIEQLGRTILSLVEAYDVCRDKKVHCENEPEFRAYYLLLNAHDPSITQRVPEWGREHWFDSEEVQTALSLIQAMHDARETKGPIKPRRQTTFSDTSFTSYFSIVEEPRVSYTMACVAEIHFTTVRQGILKNLVRGYSRHRDAPRTITASDLNAILRFDTPEEAVEFAELHDFEFSTWVPEGKNPVPEPYLLLNNKRRHVPSPRVRQSYSGKLVERKRTTQSLPHVIYNTIYEEQAEQLPTGASSPDGLFVTQAPASKDLASPSPTFAPPVKPSTTPAVAPPPFGTAMNITPFSSVPPSTTAPAGIPAPAFSGFPASQPTSTASSPFGALVQPAPQPQAAKSPFLSQNPSPLPATGTTSTPGTTMGQAASAPATAPPLVANKPAEAPSLFGFLKDTTAAKPSSTLSATQQPATTAPPAPSFPGSTVFQPTTTSSTAQPTPAATEPVGSVPSSIFGAAPPAGPPSISTTPATQSQQQATPAPAVPSIFVSAPSTTTAPPTQAAVPAFPTAPAQPIAQIPLPGPVSQTPAFPALGGSTTVPPAPPPAPKRDLMGDFTKWFVEGDDGLMEHFTEEVLRHMLWDVWQEFQRQETERKRREADEESWRIAREHQSYRLRVKYFNRWRNKARALATKRILREGKEKMRLYREQQKAALKQQKEEQEKAEREAKRAAERRLMEDSERLSLLAASTRRRNSVAYSADHNPEEQLLASGIFAGLRDDPRSVARCVVRETAATNGGDSWAVGSASRSFRYAESELELEPARSSRASPDTSSVGGRREGWKTRSLREKFGIEPRRSLSASGSVVNGGSFASSISRFRQSLPGNGAFNKTTNFSASSRKRSAEEEADDERGSDMRRSLYSSVNGNTNGAKTNGLHKSRHWDLRARGFVPMPDGHWLPEALARSTRRDTSSGGKKPYGSSLSGSPDHDFLLHDADADAEMADNTSSRAASPTPSDLQLRLAKLKKPRPGPGGHASRHSVDLAPTSTARFTAAGLLDSSPPHPPHPPFAAAGSPSAAARLMRPPPLPMANQHSGGSSTLGLGFGLGLGMGKRKRDSAGMDEDNDEQGRELSPPLMKKANLDATAASAVPGSREETSAMVENTRRMLRELREKMDRVDREEGRSYVGAGGY